MIHLVYCDDNEKCYEAGNSSSENIFTNLNRPRKIGMLKILSFPQ